MSSALYSILILILLIYPEAETVTQLTGSPSKPSNAVEGENITLLWTYTLDGTIGSVTVDNVTDSTDSVGKAFRPGSFAIEPNYEPRFRGQALETQAELTIVRVQRSDRGRYRLTVTPTGTGSIEDFVELIVQSPASFTNVSGSQQEVIEGSILSLFCEASGIPPPNITWVKVLKDGSDSAVLHTEPTWNFNNIGRDKNGTYRCIAFNQVGNPAKRTITVNVLVHAKAVLPNASYVKREQDASLYCQVEGNPPPSILWTPCDPPDLVCDRAFLNISKVQTSRTNYTCTAKNNLGSDNATTILIIGGNEVYVRLSTRDEECTGSGKDEKLEPAVNDAFADVDSYSSVKLSDGSETLVVILELTFKTPVAEDFVISTLQNAIAGGKLGACNVNKSSIIGIAPVIQPTTTSTRKTSSDSDDKMWIIVGAVLGSVAFVVIIVLIVWCVRKKKGGKEVSHKKGAGQEGGGPSTRLQGQNSGYQDSVDTYANTSMLPPTRKPATNNTGEKEQPQALPMYAQVDKSKRKPRPEGPAKRQPGELQYAAVDHTNNSGSMPRGTANEPKKPPAYGETVYADLV